MVGTIACFLTCGYTETGAMQAFLKKINPNYTFKQYLPNKTIKKKGDPKVIKDELSGLSGEDLLNKVYEIVEKNKDELKKCKGILIEDDLDGKFYQKSAEEVEIYCSTIEEKIHALLGNEIPVFLLYASPEIEAWFIADWEHGLGEVYSAKGIIDVESNARLFYVHHLKHFIENEVLKEYACDIEEYGYFGGKYIKLSDELIEVIQIRSKEYISLLPRTNPEYVRQINESRYLYYSKKMHGNTMLRNIDPVILAEKCRHFFLPTYNELAYLP